MTPGRTYDQIVPRFARYNCTREPNLEVRGALRTFLVRSKQRGEPTFIYANNLLEGFAPGTIAAVTDPFPVQSSTNPHA